MSDDIRNLDRRIEEYHSWRGPSKIDRRSVLANHGILANQTLNTRSFPWGGVATAMGAMLIFLGIVIGFAVMPPATRYCKAMRDSIGLRGDQTLGSCIWEITVDRLLPWRRR